MERLTNREYGEISCTGREIPCSSFCNNCSQGTGNCEIVKRMVEKLADYEDLEDQGRLVKLPCKVGDTVYLIKNSETIVEREADMMFIGVLWEEFGKEWFSKKSEAEAKLKELQGKV